MKTTYIKTFALILGTAFLAACSENSWNDEHLDGFETPPVYYDDQTINYTLTAENYETISKLAANSTSDADLKAVYQAIGTNHSFPSQEIAREIIPLLFTQTSFPYFTLDNGSSLVVTYALNDAPTEEITMINNGTPEYRVTTADYQAAWASDDDYIEAFAPMKPASAYLPSILSGAIENPMEGQYAVVNYNEATTNPIFGTVSGGEEEPGEFELTDVIKNAKEGDAINAKGIVTGLSTRGFVVTDLGGSICYDSGSNSFNDDAIAIGAEVEVSGTVSVYSRCLQIGKDQSYKVVGTTDYTYPSPTVYTPAMVDAACAGSGNLLAEYVALTAKVSISGNYINLIIDGAECQGSVYYAPDFIKSQLADGSTYTLYGYFVAVTGSGKYFNLLVTSVESPSAAGRPAKAPVGTTETIGKNAVYTYDGSKWVAPANTIVLQPADYTAMNQSYGNLSGNLPETILPTYLNNNYPYASADDVMVVVFKYYNGSSTSYQGRQFIYSVEEGWIDGNKVSDRFSKSNNAWKFNPSVTLTLPSGRNQAFSSVYYQACTDWVYYNIDVPLGSTSITSGIGYVTTYGNNEYYSGSSAYQNNVDLRASAARGQYAAGYENMADDEVVETMKERFVYEVFPGALGVIYSDVDTIEGVEILYTVTFAAYYGTANDEHLATQRYVGVWKVTGKAKFEFVSCVSVVEDGQSSSHNFLNK